MRLKTSKAHFFNDSGQRHAEKAHFDAKKPCGDITDAEKDQVLAVFLGMGLSSSLATARYMRGPLAAKPRRRAAVGPKRAERFQAPGIAQKPQKNRAGGEKVGFCLPKRATNHAAAAQTRTGCPREHSAPSPAQRAGVSRRARRIAARFRRKNAFLTRFRHRVAPRTRRHARKLHCANPHATPDRTAPSRPAPTFAFSRPGRARPHRSAPKIDFFAERAGALLFRGPETSHGPISDAAFAEGWSASGRVWSHIQNHDFRIDRSCTETTHQKREIFTPNTKE